MFEDSFRDSNLSANINLYESFGDLENSSKEEPMFKSKLGKNNAIREPNPANERESTDFYNQSIFSDKRGNILGVNRVSS